MTTSNLSFAKVDEDHNANNKEEEEETSWEDNKDNEDDAAGIKLYLPK